MRRAESSNQGDISLSVEGYKAIRNKTRLRIAPLTIVAGVNSSGKSSFMQPFLLMKQTLDSAFDPGPLLLHGPNVKVTDRSQLLSRGKSRHDLVGEFTATMEQGTEARSVTFATSGQDVVVERDEIRSKGELISLAERLTASDQAALRAKFEDRAKQYIDIFGSVESHNASIDDWGFAVYRNRCFLELLLEIARSDRTMRINLSDEIADDQRWVNLLRGIIHVPGLRGNPERSYSRSAVGETYPGTFETYVASIVYEWTVSDDNKLAILAGQLESLGLTWKLAARRLNDASLELVVGRMPHAQQGGAHDLVSVADVGFGVSQTLPVLVALLAAKKGQIVYIEQPEIHLHPRAQLALADVLVAAAARGVKVVAETHSSLLIRGIQTAVAQKRLPPSNLSFNWFGRDASTGFQTVTTAQVDEVGRFGDWPLDFDEISQEADWAFLDSVQDQAP